MVGNVDDDESKFNGVDEGKPARDLESDIAKAVGDYEGVYVDTDSSVELNRLDYRGCVTNSRCDIFLVERYAKSWSEHVYSESRSVEYRKQELYTVEFS